METTVWVLLILFFSWGSYEFGKYRVARRFLFLSKQRDADFEMLCSEINKTWKRVVGDRQN